MDSVRRLVDKSVDAATILLLCSMVVIVFAQVLFRYVVQSSPPWTEEFSRFNFIWLTFMGSTAVFRRKGHLIIDTLVMLLPPRVNRVLNVPVQIMISVLLLILIDKGIELCRSGWLTRASTMHISLTVIYLSVPVSAVLMLFYQLSWLVDLIKERELKQ
jgi:TRAP-type transport system small permease protein